MTAETTPLWRPLAENDPRIFVEPSLSDRAVDQLSSRSQVVLAVLIIAAVLVLLALCGRADEGRGLPSWIW